jgi:hypothetical protein
MDAKLHAIELTGTVDEQHHLMLDSAIPITGPRRVRVIVLYPLDDQINEDEWLYAAAHNPAFDFLKESTEDIYSLQDGKPFDDQA